MSRVSVVVRTKNRPWFLARALDDIAAQTFRDLQVVVVDDDGDLEQSRAVVAASAVADAAVVVSTRTHGRCAAANEGIGQATGEFVILHDDDDLWDPAFLEKTVGWLDAHPEDMGVITRTTIRYEAWRDGRWTPVGEAPFWSAMTSVSLSEMLGVNRAVPIAFLYRRAVHDVVGGYDESLDAVEDWEFSLRLLSRHSIGFIPEALAVWTQRPSAAAADANSMFALAGEHRRDDQIVRDRELQSWIAREGLGLPLLIAGEFERLRSFMTDELTRQLDRRHPLSALARRGILASRRRRGLSG